jgi:hypothetical protein
VSRRQVAGAVLSIAGVLVVLSRGQWELLMQVQLVPGDLYVLLATLAWAFYSWLLSQPKEPPELRRDWAAFLLAQIVFGLAWSGAFAAGEWALTDAHIQWGWPLAAALLYVAVGPGGDRLPLLGHGRAARGAGNRGLLFQPHAAVRRPAVGGLSRRAAAPLPRAGLCADRGRDCGVVAALRRSHSPGKKKHGEQPALLSVPNFHQRKSF